jgi:hypothetical protein
MPYRLIDVNLKIELGEDGKLETPCFGGFKRTDRSPVAGGPAKALFAVATLPFTMCGLL